MKRGEIIRKIRKAAKDAGLEYVAEELTNHTGVVVGGVPTTVSRSTADFGWMAETIFKQLEPALGEGWWRK
jgi:hypothetical protein